MYTHIDDIPSGPKKNRLLKLPRLSQLGECDWILRKDFPLFEFKTFGCIRRGTPEGFPQGLRWATRRQGHKILAIRCTGFDPDFDKPLSNAIAPHIRKHYKNAPCIFTGTTTDVELDHRMGDKSNPEYARTVDVATQRAADFMPIARIINDIKREACKKCCAGLGRPDPPPLFRAKRKDGDGCDTCFWAFPEQYI